MPHMQDPFFGKAVVFMCEHDKQGAMGLIVNKPFRDLELKEEFDQLYEDSDEILSAVSQVYFGGPVLVERGILLHGEKIHSDNSIKISDDFFISTHKQTLAEMKIQNGDNQSRLLLGHSGWISGQLEREIENGDWLVQETSPDFIFNVPVEQMWGIAIKSFSIDVSDFSAFGGKA